jgi:hypothetical protein
MRSLMGESFLLISLASSMVSGPNPAFAQEDCSRKGCGCKGGPGWRAPEGTCVPEAKLAEVCGSQAGAPCKLEAAPRVCFGREALRSEPPGQTKPN